jgi:protein-S-isoprenylcysteine O-methyltransferase Ste14
MLPPAFLLISILTMTALHFLAPVSRFIALPWSLLGLVALACGILINVVADRAFRRAGTTVKPLEDSAALITSGVYRFSRHPMYLGLVLILVGIAILLGSLTPFLVILAFAFLLDRRFIVVEEQMLEQRFGQRWVEYKAGVRRWI